MTIRDLDIPLHPLGVVKRDPGDTLIDPPGFFATRDEWVRYLAGLEAMTYSDQVRRHIEEARHVLQQKDGGG